MPLPSVSYPHLTEEESPASCLQIVLCDRTVGHHQKAVSCRFTANFWNCLFSRASSFLAYVLPRIFSPHSRYKLFATGLKEEMTKFMGSGGSETPLHEHNVDYRKIFNGIFDSSKIPCIHTMHLQHMHLNSFPSPWRSQPIPSPSMSPPFLFDNSESD